MSKMQKKKWVTKTNNNQDQQSIITQKNARSDNFNGTGKNMVIEDFDNERQEKDIQFKFAYSFNEYLRFVLIKLLPLKNTKIRIDVEGKKMIGPTKQCQQLLQKINKQLDLYCMKIIKFKEQADVESIQYEIGDKYDSKVYRKKYIQRGVDDVIYHFKFEVEGKSFIKKLQNNLILVRLKKQTDKQCLKEIQKILNNSQNQSSIISSRVQTQVTQRPVQNKIKLKEKLKTQQKPSNRPKQAQKSNASNSQSQSLKEEDSQEEPSYYQTLQKSQISLGNPNLLSRTLDEPYEDDSISMVNNNEKRLSRKQQKQKKRLQVKQQERLPQRRKIQYKVVKQYEYMSEYFDQDDFRDWLKKTKFTQDQIRIDSSRDPYNDDQVTDYVIKLVQESTISQTDCNQKIQALDIYFKFKKVIMIKMKNQKCKNQLMTKYEQQDQIATVKVIKGYKSPKWPQRAMWKYIKQQKYSDVKKSANSQYFQAFFIQGIKSYVQELQKKIQDDMQNQNLEDVVNKLQIKIDELTPYLKSNQLVISMVKSYIENCILQYFNTTCSLNKIQFLHDGIQLQLNVKFDQQSAYHKNIKDTIIKKIKDDVKIQKHDVNFSLDKFAYQQLQKKNIVLLEKNEKGFTFLSISSDLGQNFRIINQICNNLNELTQKQMIIESSLIAKKLQNHLKQLIKSHQFKQIKFNKNCENGKQKFKFYGRRILLQTMLRKVNEFLQQINNQIVNYIQIIKQKQGQMLKTSEKFKQLIPQKIASININNKQIECKLIIQNDIQNFKTKSIIIKKSETLDYAPYGSVIIFREMKEIQLFKNNYFLKTFKNYLKKNSNQVMINFNQNSRNYGLLLLKGGKGSVLLKNALDYRPHCNDIVLIMPPDNKKAFIKDLTNLLIEDKKYAERQINLLIIESTLAANVQAQIGIEPYSKGKKKIVTDQTITKYFVSDKNQKFYYSQAGNTKINNAKKIGLPSVILNNEDLKINFATHQYNSVNKNITHLQSAKEFPVTINGNVVEFMLKNRKFEMPPSQGDIILNCINKSLPNVNVSLGVYQIDLIAMSQVNMFSEFKRSVQTEITIIKADPYQQKIKALYNIKISEIQYQYLSNEEGITFMHNITRKVNDFIKEQYIVKNFETKDVSAEDIEMMRDYIEEDDITEFTYHKNNDKAIVKTLDQRDFLRTQLILKNIQTSKQMKNSDKIYPLNWQPQTQDIQAFQVDSKTIQFADIQSKFTLTKIKQLIRIQNKIIFKKYYEQSIFLASMNGGQPIKKMHLFHGTKNTNPEQIYKDKEESFNINYSSDNNLLGRGIYFAQKSQYSNSYRFTQQNGIFSGTYSMFLCQVSVGQSQKCPNHNANIKDTSYRDATNKIKYQSMTDYLSNSNIYVVYKSRRAYPLYLIKY